jgi:hypothetical protein
MLLDKKIFALTVYGFLSMNLFAADLYVSSTGNNANSGASASSPLATISRAAQLVKRGGTVYVAQGIYKENVVTSVNGTATERVRYVANGKVQVIGSGINAMWFNKADYTDIIGFDVSGTGRLGIQNDGSFVVMSGNHVHDLKVSGGCTGAGGAGIMNADYSASDNEISGNLVHDIGIRGACNAVHGIYSANLRAKIFNNVVYNSASWGIHLWHASTNSVVANNTSYNNGLGSMGGGIVMGTGDAPGGVVFDDSTVINNIVFNNPAGSILEYCSSGEDCIGNNIKIANNLIFGNGKGITLRKGTSSGTITLDPQLVNYQLGDYNLKSSSPAIDKGVLSGAPVKDFTGTTRSAAPDIGAYEFKAALVLSANAGFSASSFAFDSTNVGVKSSSKLLTISNFGNANLVLRKLNLSGAFALDASASTCVIGNAYVPGSKCIVAISFSPVVAGSASGSLSVESNSATAVTNISLAGQGLVIKPMISLSANSLSFGSVNLGTNSSSQTIKVTNSGTGSLIFSSASSTSGDFLSNGASGCLVNTAYAPNASCTISVSFKPTVAGARSGVLSIASNASAAPAQVALSGSGVVVLKPVASLSVSSLNFGSVKVGSKSAVKTVTITNTGKAPMIISQAFSLTGSFAFGGQGTCAVNVSYAPGASCTVSAVFTPKIKGAQSGSLGVNSNANAVSVGLSGTGL